MGVDDATQQRAVGGWTAERAVGAGQQAGVGDATQQRAVGGWSAERAVGGWTAERAVGAGQQAGVDDVTRQRAVGVGQQRSEQQRVGVEPRTGAVNTGHRSREARQHEIGSSESESR